MIEARPQTFQTRDARTSDFEIIETLASHSYQSPLSKENYSKLLSERYPDKEYDDVIEIFNKESNKDSLFWRLDFGSKTLVVEFYSGNNKFQTHVMTDNTKKRRDDETTIIYKAAKEIMHKAVEEKKQEIEYMLTTSNRNMIKWALTKGHAVFGWDEAQFVTPDGEIDLEQVKSRLENEDMDKLVTQFFSTIQYSNETS